MTQPESTQALVRKPNPLTQQPVGETAPRTNSAPAPTKVAGVAPIQPMPPRRSALDSILRFLGWTLAAVVVLAMVMMAAGWWTVNNMSSQIFGSGTQTTIIEGAPIVESIRRANKQILIEHYNAVDVDYSEAPEGWLSVLGIRQNFVVLLKGRVPAGFDLSQIKDEDLWISPDGSKVQLVLPPPQIFADNVSIDFEYSRILVQSDTCPGFLCKDTISAYQNDILPQGRQLLIQASERSGIMEQVVESGKLYYENLLRSLGFAEVRVIVRGTE
ncbi:MAG: DUF4230 domain-containing protein [Caldilineaceae bacterium]